MTKYARLIGAHLRGRQIAQLLGLKTLCYNPASQRAARKPMNKMPERQLQPGQESPDAKRRVRRRRVRIALLSVVTILLFTLLFVQAAFDLLPWLRPSSASEAMVLYALSTINLLAFVVLLMVLVRNIIKLRRERRRMILGAKIQNADCLVFHLALAAAGDLSFRRDLRTHQPERGKMVQPAGGPDGDERAWDRARLRRRGERRPETRSRHAGAIGREYRAESGHLDH
jgi:hypothetical protein